LHGNAWIFVKNVLSNNFSLHSIFNLKCFGLKKCLRHETREKPTLTSSDHTFICWQDCDLFHVLDKTVVSMALLLDLLSRSQPSVKTQNSLHKSFKHFYCLIAKADTY